MTVRRGEGPAVLPYDSEAYKAHRPVIESLSGRADALGLLKGQFRRQILGHTGIVCDRPHGDSDASVAKSYYGLHANLEKGGGGDETRVQRVRELLRDVLAAHLSVTEKPQNEPRAESDIPYDIYRDLIGEIEELQRKHALPSVMPFLFLASSVYSQLSRPEYRINGREEMKSLYHRMTELFIFHDKHLHALITSLQRQGENDFALEALQNAADIRSASLSEMVDGNPFFADTYASALFESGRFEEAVVFIHTLDAETVRCRPVIMEKHVRSLIQLGRMDDVIEALDAFPDVIAEPDLKKARGIACEQAAWHLYAASRIDDALTLLQKHAAQEIGPHGRENMHALVETLLMEKGDKRVLRRYQHERIIVS